MTPLPAEQKPHGPPFTVERYGTFGQSVIAERDWLLEEVERLRGSLEFIRDELTEDETDPQDVYSYVLAILAGGQPRHPDVPREPTLKDVAIEPPCLCGRGRNFHPWRFCETYTPVTRG